jgi:hypothetical protein
LGCPFGVVGLLPGVPGLSPAKPSLCFSDGVDLDDDDMLDGGRSARRSAPETRIKGVQCYDHGFLGDFGLGLEFQGS